MYAIWEEASRQEISVYSPAQRKCRPTAKSTRQIVTQCSFSLMSFRCCVGRSHVKKHLLLIPWSVRRIDASAARLNTSPTFCFPNETQNAVHFIVRNPQSSTRLTIPPSRNRLRLLSAHASSENQSEVCRRPVSRPCAVRANRLTVLEARLEQANLLKKVRQLKEHGAQSCD